MKSSLLTVLALSALALCARPLPSVRAHEGHDHDKAHAHQAGSSQEAWTTAQAAFKGMKDAAAAKQHEPIHDHQEKLAAALNAIQEKGVEGADKARLDGAIKNAIAASEKVHSAADANDFAKVDSGMKTLDATMSMVEKQVAKK
jgi:hypothetical protein